MKKKQDLYPIIKNKFIECCKDYGVAIPNEIREGTIDDHDNFTDPPNLLIIKTNPEEDAEDQARHLFGHWVLDYEAIKDTTFSSDECADIIAAITKKADGHKFKEVFMDSHYKDEVAQRLQVSEGLLNRIYGFMQQKQFSVHLLGGLQEIAKDIQKWRDDLQSLKDSRHKE